MLRGVSRSVAEKWCRELTTCVLPRLGSNERVCAHIIVVVVVVQILLQENFLASLNSKAERLLFPAAWTDAHWTRRKLCARLRRKW